MGGVLWWGLWDLQLLSGLWAPPCAVTFFLVPSIAEGILNFGALSLSRRWGEIFWVVVLLPLSTMWNKTVEQTCLELLSQGPGCDVSSHCHQPGTWRRGACPFLLGFDWALPLLFVHTEPLWAISVYEVEEQVSLHMAHFLSIRNSSWYCNVWGLFCLINY